MEDEFIAKLATLEEKSKVSNKRIDDLEERTKDMPRFEILMETFKESNREFSQTLKEININITGLNGEMKNLTSQVASLGGRVEKLEENDGNNKIDVVKLGKRILIGAITGIAIYLIYQGLHINN